jgi:hypothetical protein
MKYIKTVEESRSLSMFKWNVISIHFLIIILINNSFISGKNLSDTIINNYFTWYLIYEMRYILFIFINI